MNLGALALDIGKIRVQAATHDLVDLAKTKRSAQPARQPVRPAVLRVELVSAIALSALWIISAAKRTDRGNSELSSRNSAMRSGLRSAV